MTPRHVSKGIDGLRAIKSLKIIETEEGRVFFAAEFWRRYDAGEFNKPPTVGADDI